MHCIHCFKNVSSLSSNNLCEICEYTFQRSVEIVKGSANIINTTKNTDTFINQCSVALRVLERLKEFEHLNLIEPTPTKIIDDIIEKRTDTLFEQLNAYLIHLHQKLDDIDSIERIIKIIEKAKTDFGKYEFYILDSEKLEELKFFIQMLTDKFIISRYNALVSDASEYEKKGKIKLALKKLNQAIKEFTISKNYFPERDHNLDSELEEWIERLKYKSHLANL